MIYKLQSKKCSKCKLEKDVSFFHKDSKNRYGLTSQCKDCIRKRTNAYNRANPEKKREQNYLTRYGISLSDYENLYKKQNGKCAICKNKLEKGVVDHNHTTGEVRGILCNSCNTAIGLAKENPEILSNMIEYIQRSCNSVGECLFYKEKVAGSIPAGTIRVIGSSPSSPIITKGQ